MLSLLTYCPLNVLELLKKANTIAGTIGECLTGIEKYVFLQRVFHGIRFKVNER